MIVKCHLTLYKYGATLNIVKGKRCVRNDE